MSTIPNRISFSVTAADLADIQAAIKVLQDKLVPRLVSLSAQDRRGLLKMGDKTVAFVSKASEYAKEHLTLCPPYLDMAEFQRDVEAIHTLQSLVRPVAQAADALSDSLMLAGSDAYSAALVFYQSVKGAARTKVPGAATIADDLGSRFVGRPSGSTAALRAARAAKRNPPPQTPSDN